MDSTLEMSVNRACSKSYIAVLPAHEKLSVEQDVRQIVEEGEGKVWTDKTQMLFQYPYHTFAVLARRKF